MSDLTNYEPIPEGARYVYQSLTGLLTTIGSGSDDPYYKLIGYITRDDVHPLVPAQPPVGSVFRSVRWPGEYLQVRHRDGAWYEHNLRSGRVYPVSMSPVEYNSKRVPNSWEEIYRPDAD